MTSLGWHMRVKTVWFFNGVRGKEMNECKTKNETYFRLREEKFLNEQLQAPLVISLDI